MAEDGTVAAGQYGGKPASLATDARVTNGVDAAVHPMQPPSRDPAIDRVLAQPDFDQLPSTDDAVLSAGERGDSSLKRSRVKLPAHSAVNFTLGEMRGHSARTMAPRV